MKPTLKLQPFVREDCATLAGWLRTPALAEMTAPDWTFPVTSEEIEDAYFANPKEGELWKAVENGRMVGHVGIRIAGQVGHLFHVIVDPALHRQGYGRAMMDRLLETAFRDLDLHRISLYVFDQNPVAVSFYQACGYQMEGRHRDHFCM